MEISVKQRIKDLVCSLVYHKVIPGLSKKSVPYSLNCLGEGVQCFELEDVQAGVYSKHSMEFLREQKFLEACETVINGLPPGAKKVFREDLRLRFYTSCKFAKIASSLEGCFVSIGVSFGVTPRLVLEYTSSKKEYWLVDNWDGYDPFRSRVVKAHTVHGGYCSDVDDVREIFGGYDNIRIVQGFAPESLRDIEADKISFLHLDTTDQECESASIEYLWDRIVPGGIIVIDTFNLGRGYEVEYAPLFKKLGCSDGVIGTAHGQGIIVKR